MTEPELQGSLSQFTGVVLAAGRGSRMKSAAPKVLLDLAGKPMVVWVVEVLQAAGVDPICVVVSQGNSDLRGVLGADLLYAVQTAPRGSGDAVAAARDTLQQFPGSVIVACGDSPLFRAETVRRTMREHLRKAAVVTLVSAELDDPGGYGRIVRHDDGVIRSIVEERDASSDEKMLREVNGGLYAFDASWLWSSLSVPKEIREEFVLTEIVSEAVQGGLRVASVNCSPEEIAGANTPEQLREAASVLRRRLERQVTNEKDWQ